MHRDVKNIDTDDGGKAGFVGDGRAMQDYTFDSNFPSTDEINSPAGMPRAFAI